MVNQHDLADRIRGEAFLLLDAAQQASEKADRELQETFLLHKLADLRAVCHPWHSILQWERLTTAQ